MRPRGPVVGLPPDERAQRDLEDMRAARHPETVTIAALWPRLSENMTAHLRDEEENLFPYIKRLVQGQATEPSFVSAQALIAQMKDDHEDVGAA